MTKLLITCLGAIALLAAAALLGAASAQGGQATTASCGFTTYKGVRAHRACGPAAATLKMSGRTIRYRGGVCARRGGDVNLTIGISLLGRDVKPLPRFFGLTLARARRDGTYRNALVSFVDRGKRFASMDSQVTLAGGRTRGTFTARLLGGPTVSGTFRCS